MLGKYLEQVRTKAPLIHNITNYVTVNDVANVLLACGGSPIMSDEPADIIDITSICNGLNINIGTLNVRTIEAMSTMGEDMRKEKVTPRGKPARVKAMNNGMDEQAQKGVTVPSSAPTTLPLKPLKRPRMRLLRSGGK